MVVYGSVAAATQMKKKPMNQRLNKCTMWIEEPVVESMQLKSGESHDKGQCRTRGRKSTIMRSEG